MPPPVRHVIIGTAGHVDHGKTTLIRALTGTDTDRLAEEKARGMTIDLGFAFLRLPGDPPVDAGIVDVPGHERFVKNMLAGAGGVDVALVVVAADEGPMPQTREHLEILTVLGVAHGVVALTKADLADAELRALAAEETRSALRGTTLAGCPILPVSAETGEGLPALVAALAEAAASAMPRDPGAPFRLPVDRVFSLPGVGTVVTGTLVAGTLGAGDVVAVQPQDLTAKARILQTHNRRIEAAEPGTRVAVNLPGVEVGQVERGAVVCAPGTLAATSLFDARLTLLPGASEGGSEGARGLKHRERVRVHLGTGEVLARVLLLADAAAAAGATDVPAQILCESPAAPAAGERFVVRSYSPARVVGGGVVVEPRPARRYRRGDTAAKALFDARAAASGATDRAYAVLAARHAALTPAEVAAASGGALTPESAALALEILAGERRASLLPDGTYVSDAAGSRLVDTARRVAAQFHRQNPLKRAVPREALRAPLQKAAAFPDFNAVLTWLTSRDVLSEEGPQGVRLPEHEVTIPPGWQRPAEEIRSVYAAAGLLPPSPDNFQVNYPRDVNVRAILGILVENGELVSVGEGLYLSAAALEQAKEVIRRLAGTPGGITVGTVRDATNSSRKVILPLLEYLDAQRFTKRVGDARVLA